MNPRSNSAHSGRAATLDQLFFALADQTRRELLEHLRDREDTAGNLAAGFAVTRPAVSRHLRVLRAAKLVREERRGRERVYRLAPERLQTASEWLDSYRVFWPARLRDLKSFVESLPDEPERTSVRRSRSTRKGRLK
jgi:DNA-binding transcriptional ArsR family regulator